MLLVSLVGGHCEPIRCWHGTSCQPFNLECEFETGATFGTAELVEVRALNLETSGNGVACEALGVHPSGEFGLLFARPASWSLLRGAHWDYCHTAPTLDQARHAQEQASEMVNWSISRGLLPALDERAARNQAYRHYFVERGSRRALLLPSPLACQRFTLLASSGPKPRGVTGVQDSPSRPRHGDRRSAAEDAVPWCKSSKIRAGACSGSSRVKASSFSWAAWRRWLNVAIFEAF